MNELTPLFFCLLTMTFLLAGTVKGITGMGLPLVAMGIIGAVFSPIYAASLLIIPSFITNVWQLFTGGNVLKITNRFLFMMLGITLGTLIGSKVLINIDKFYSNISLGFILILYSTYGFFAKPFHIPTKIEKIASPFIGLMTGLINGATGVFTVPAVPYLQSLGLSKDDLVQAFGLSFTVSTIALGIGLAQGGILDTSTVTLSVLAVAPSLIGMKIGTILRRKLNENIFRKGLLYFLIAIGLELILGWPQFCV